MLQYAAISVPSGSVGLVAGDAGLRHVLLRSCPAAETRAELKREFPNARPEPRLLPEFQEQIRDYYAGRPVIFDVRIDLSALTPFQQSVLKRCAKIPYGRKVTYGGLARAVGRPSAARAVGHALGRNPLPLVIPCHRVVGCNGALVGFSAEGGVTTKRTLLELEAGALGGI